jgi:hypothetical protein
MVEHLTKRIVPILLAALLLPSCSYYSKSASDQRAYDRYVKKNSGIQYKERRKIKTARARMPVMPPPSPNRVTADASDGPQSVTSGESQNQ